MGRRDRRAARPADPGGPVLSAILLDTNILIHAERGSGAVGALIGDDDLPAIAAITLAELGVGVDLARGRRRERRRAFLDEVGAVLPVLPYDASVAQAHRTLLVAVRRSGRPRGAHDLIIAATALATGRVVVTSDARGFAYLPGVEVRHPDS